MEIRYKLVGNHYERETPDPSLKINEVLFLKYFEPEVDNRVKKFDGLVASFAFPTAIVERLLRFSMLLFYLALAALICLTAMAFSNPEGTGLLPTQGSLWERARGLIETGFGGKTGVFMECATVQNGNISSISCQKRNQIGNFPAHNSTSSPVAPTANPAPFFGKTDRLRFGEDVFQVSGKSFLPQTNLNQKLAIGACLFFFAVSFILSHLLATVRRRVEFKLLVNLEMMVAEENLSQSLFKFRVGESHGRLKVQVNPAATPSTLEAPIGKKIPDSPPKPEYFRDSEKENIECVNRSGYGRLPFAQED